MFGFMDEVISCRQAAVETRRALGLGALAPNAAALLAQMDACEDCECEGTRRHAVIALAFETVQADKVLALLN